ncbi:exported hypothetical protein [Xenorhabdus bovienii str. kraussei Becker Underwood]|uniref:Uncharacterized protein n=1 Tax=Xenorhabdus bovienii str. kraussei Becker Underwood TaxID=1398204 RepID=A0A077PP18_XENBV|nr:exported hypothetical protein [Xenorhabdus bovienii str. kraussei Becker Underwood]
MCDKSDFILTFYLLFCLLFVGGLFGFDALIAYSWWLDVLMLFLIGIIRG